MDKLNRPYSVGIWTVRVGNEDIFIREWKAFADWTVKNQPGAMQGFLLQDSVNPQKFISFGAFESADIIDSWRNRAEFRAFAGRAKGLCESFEPHTLRLMAVTEAIFDPHVA